MTRNLIVCTDGTWNRPDQIDRDRVVPSNVVKTARALSGKTHEGIHQLVYYDTGVGTGGRWDHLKEASPESGCWRTSNRPITSSA